MNKLWLNKKLYQVDSIEIAKKHYEQLAKISHEKNNEYHVLSFEDCYFDEQLTMKEFENYVLDLMVRKNGE